MKLKIDQRKYRKKILPFWIPISTLLFAVVMVVVMNIIESNEFNLEKIGVISGLLFLVFISSIFPIFYYRLKKRREFIMVFENGVFTNYSKPLIKPISVKMEDIRSITLWRNGKINQYKIVTIKDEPTNSALMNQLKANHTYVTDYMVDSEELNKLMLLMQKEINE